MTEEIRQRANKLHTEIEHLTNQIAVVEDMHHSDIRLQIRCDDIGSIFIESDDELKDDIIDLILSKLTPIKEAKEDEYRML